VHRKGSTRAFGPGRPENSGDLSGDVGQPVICGGFDGDRIVSFGRHREGPRRKPSVLPCMAPAGQCRATAAKRVCSGARIFRERRWLRKESLSKPPPCPVLAEEGGFAYKRYFRGGLRLWTASGSQKKVGGAQTHRKY